MSAGAVIFSGEPLTSLLLILAQTPTTQQADPPFLMKMLQNPMYLFAIMAVIMYMLIIRPKQRQDRSKKDMMAALAKGARVQTIGGIFGTVLEVRDNEVLLKVDESSNTKIRFTRSAIYRVVDEEKPATK